MASLTDYVAILIVIVIIAIAIVAIILVTQVTYTCTIPGCNKTAAIAVNVILGVIALFVFIYYWAGGFRGSFIILAILVAMLLFQTIWNIVYVSSIPSDQPSKGFNSGFFWAMVVILIVTFTLIVVGFIYYVRNVYMAALQTCVSPQPIQASTLASISGPTEEVRG